jgi:hypothetical protein
LSVEQKLLAGIASALTAAGSAAKITGGSRYLLAKLGWDLPPGVEDIGLAALDVERVGTNLTKWITVSGDPQVSDTDQALALAELAGAVIDVLVDLRNLHLQAPQDYLDKTKIKDEFLTRLFDLYLIQSSAIASHEVFDIAILLGWFELKRFEADPAKFQVAHLRHIVHWDRVPKLFTDPTGLFQEVYGWGTATFRADDLVIRLGAVIQHISTQVSQRPLPALPLARLHGGTPPPHAPQLQLFLPFIGTGPPISAEAGISVFGLPPTTAGGVDGGIGLAPFAQGAATLRFPISSMFSIGMSSKADLGSGLALMLRPNKDPQLRTGLNEAQAGAGSAGAEVKVDLTMAAPQGQPPLTLLTIAGAKVEATSISIATSVVVDGRGTDATVRLQLQGGKFSLTADDLPFVQSALPAEGLVVQADVDLSWSHRNGVQLDGSAELKARRAIKRRIGPVTIDTLALAVAVRDSGLDLTASVSASVGFGPVLIVVEEIGVRSSITPGPGSLGSADLTIRPTPPSGLGIVVDAPTVVGGGFLRFDPQKGEYSGVLELKIAEKISVKGFGLLTTKLPGGGKGFAFLIIIFVEGFTPIPLGFGFKLTGIGGLLAINRTFDENALRTGLKEQTLDSVMFPKDPIRNAPQILSNLNKVFPPAIGHHLFGPMVQISWGTPTLITAELAIVLEFGQRLRLLILAQIAAILPDPKNDLVRMQMDAVGVIDFDQGTAELDATLRDSRLLKKFVLTGDMAMRLKWQSSPNFALAIGGLHPAFNPPPNFPKLERVAINLAAGDNPRLRCEAYFALTSNTVQFGARAELYASAAGFSVHGDIGFDVLIQFDPFFFVADFHAQLQLKRGSTNLFKVRLEGSLSGPRPLHVKGKATFEILWWDYSIRIDKTLVEGEKPPLPAPVDVFPLLRDALANRGNWVGQLPTGRPVATLRENPGAAKDVLLHPLGSLTVKQAVVPLNFDISQFGQSVPAGARRFAIKADLTGHTLEIHTVNDFFARAQFVKMTDDQKLSAPSFESMEAGVTMKSEEFSFSALPADWIEVNTIEFETWILDDKTDALRRSESELPKQPGTSVLLYQLTAKLLEKQASFGAAANSELRSTGAARYRTTTVGKYQVTKDGWTIIKDDLKPATIPTTYSEATESLQKIRQQDPTRAATLKLVRFSEIASKV